MCRWLLLFICLFIYSMFVVNNDTPTYFQFVITLYLSVIWLFLALEVVKTMITDKKMYGLLISRSYDIVAVHKGIHCTKNTAMCQTEVLT